MRRSITLTMRLPHGRPTCSTITANIGRPMRDLIKETVSAFANRRGVSYYAVDYDVAVRA